MRQILLTVMCGVLAFPVFAQVSVQFETADHRALGVYDTWQDSPFRTGRLKGNCAVVANPVPSEANASARVLALQRSRHGSNTFGARIDLKKPFALTPQVQYLHVLIHKPVAGRAMLVGLGKRTDRPGQSAETEQFWVQAVQPLRADRWEDAVFPVKGSEGVQIHSLVVVVDNESPHHQAADFVAYVDDVDILPTAASRTAIGDPSAEALADLALAEGDSSEQPDSVEVRRDGGLNGDLLLADGATVLSRVRVPFGQPFVVVSAPAPGFVLKHVVVRYGRNLSAPEFVGGARQYAEAIVPASAFRDGKCVLPSRFFRHAVRLTPEFSEQVR